MEWSFDAARDLIQNPSFRALFEDEEGPVMRAVRALERVALDPRSAAEKQHDAACQRAGILFVLDVVVETLKKHDRDLAAEADRLRHKSSPVQSKYVKRYPG